MTLSKDVTIPDAATAVVLTLGERELQGLGERFERHFARKEVRQRLPRYLAGLLSPGERRNGWQVAEQIGDRAPDGVQRLMQGAR